MRVSRSAFALSALLVVILSSCGVARHRDGEGPLAYMDDPGGYTRITVERTPGQQVWSFGMPVCMKEAGTTAVLETIEPHGLVGEGVEEVGVAVHEVSVDQGDVATGSAGGFPPDNAPETLRLGGYEVTAACSTPPPEVVPEILVGLGLRREEGGGWLGIDVTYRVDGREYVLELRNEMFICGDATVEYCEPQPSP
jgi:hypothetical protein